MYKRRSSVSVYTALRGNKPQIVGVDDGIHSGRYSQNDGDG